MPKTSHHRLFLAKISLALAQELRRRPTDEELQRVLRVVELALKGLTIIPTTSAPSAPRLSHTTQPTGGPPC